MQTDKSNYIANIGNKITRSLKGLGERGSDLSNSGNNWGLSTKGKKNPTADKHGTLVPKDVFLGLTNFSLNSQL